MPSASPDDWQRLDELFQAALELPPAQRLAYLRSETAEASLVEEVVRLLDAVAASEELFGDGAAGALSASELSTFLKTRGPRPGQSERPSGAAGAPGRLGPWQLAEEVGRGGMGTVYRAERADGAYERTVAVKLLRRGLDTEDVVERFRVERQILASLDDPRIARLLDGGATTDGLPFLVMEHVDGEPITAWCDRRRLPLEDRLRLFIEVGEAVQHAHSRLVVHRDLKPSNILVTADGHPKLLDFGIAKLLDDRPDVALTRTGVLPMTPQYAAPEQVRGRSITTATDVYQLGMLLHELLTGRPPYEVTGQSATEVERVVCDREVRPPSVSLEGTGAEAAAAARRSTPPALRRRLRGDLDTIVGKALQKDPERRYVSAERLVDDVRRHLTRRPILARPASRMYQVRRFVARNRPAVAMAAMVLVLLVAYGGTVTVQQRATAAARDQARAAQAAAEMEAATAERATAFMVSMFRGVLPEGGQRRDTVSVLSLLDHGLERLQGDSALAAEPEVRATLVGALGEVYDYIGHSETGRELLKEAVRLRRELHPEPHPELVAALAAEADYRYRALHMDRAAALYSEALALQQQLPRADSLWTARLLLGLGRSLRRSSPDSAVALARRGVDLYRHHYRQEDSLYTGALRQLAATLRGAERLGEAEHIYRELIALQREAGPAKRGALAANLNNLGELLRTRGANDEAAAAYRESLELVREVHGSSAPPTLMVMQNLATAYLMGGRLGEAEAMLRERIRLLSTTDRVDGWRVAQGYEVLGNFQLRTDLERSVAPLDSAVSMYSKALGPDHQWTARARSNLGIALLAAGDTQAAMRHLDGSWSVLREAQPTFWAGLQTHPTLRDLVRRLLALGDTARAERYQAAIEAVEVDLEG